MFTVTQYPTIAIYQCLWDWGGTPRKHGVLHCVAMRCTGRTVCAIYIEPMTSRDRVRDRVYLQQPMADLHKACCRNSMLDSQRPGRAAALQYLCSRRPLSHGFDQRTRAVLKRTQWPLYRLTQNVKGRGKEAEIKLWNLMKPDQKYDDQSMKNYCCF
jgi:hypothetical protein